MKTPNLPILTEGDRIKLSDPQFKQSANVINAIVGALAKGEQTMSHWAMRYLLKHLDRVTLIKLYNDACSHDDSDLEKKIEAEDGKRFFKDESVIGLLLGETECDHQWGPFERSRFAGTPRRVCTQCGLVSLDNDEYPESERQADAAEADYEGREEDRRLGHDD